VTGGSRYARRSYFRRCIHVVDTVMRVVERFYALPTGALRGPRRPHSITQARMIAMFILRGATQLSTPEIGRAFCRDHSTVIHALQTVQRLLDDPQCKADVIEIAHLVALRTQSHLPAPKQKPDDLLAILPQVAEHASNGARGPDLLLAAAEAPVDGAEAPLDVRLAGPAERPQKAYALSGRAQ
jgi:hypothetical protein